MQNSNTMIVKGRNTEILIIHFDKAFYMSYKRRKTETFKRNRNKSIVVLFSLKQP